MARKVAYRKRKQNRFALELVIAVVVMLTVVVNVAENEMQKKCDGYEQIEADLQNKIDQQEKREKELEEYEKYTQTQKYVEDVAKEKLGLVYEDEIIFKTE